MKLYCAISFHGYGHLAQSAPIINTLLQRCKVKQLIIHCAAPNALLQDWFDREFTHLAASTDLGTPMLNAIQVDRASTWQQFSQQHAQKTQDLARCRHYLETHQPDLVLSNNSYLISRAAAELGIPCFHFCSLNWADNFLAYCGEHAQAREIYQALCDDYNCAETFFRLPPHMPMPGFNKVQDVGPVCRVGRKQDLAQHFGHVPQDHPRGKRYILVCLGGMPYPIDFGRWPERDDCCVINGGAPGPEHRSLLNRQSTGLNMLDLIASCDVIVTKPGYGIYMEAACAARPILYLPRGDWPEEPWLNAWQNRHAWADPITDAQLQSGMLEAAITQVLERQKSEPKARVTPTGIDTIVDALCAYLGVA